MHGRTLPTGATRRSAKSTSGHDCPASGSRCLTRLAVALASRQFHMRIGINTFLFTSPFTTESTSLFSTFKKWGFETVEIPVEDPSHIDPVKVRQALDQHGLKCGSVCACMGPGRDLRGTPED